jgi:hypothetical protein
MERKTELEPKIQVYHGCYKNENLPGVRIAPGRRPCAYCRQWCGSEKFLFCGCHYELQFCVQDQAACLLPYHRRIDKETQNQRQKEQEEQPIVADNEVEIEEIKRVSTIWFLLTWYLVLLLRKD